MGVLTLSFFFVSPRDSIEPPQPVGPQRESARARGNAQSGVGRLGAVQNSQAAGRVSIGAAVQPEGEARNPRSETQVSSTRNASALTFGKGAIDHTTSSVDFSTRVGNARPRFFFTAPAPPPA